MAKKRNNYFDRLTAQTDYVVRGVEVVERIFKDFHPDEIEEILLEMHELEHSADEEHHKISRALAREFITPIDREDIAKIAHEIDEVIDELEDVVMRLYMFNITGLRKESFEFVEIFKKCALEMMRMMAEFKNFRKSERINDHIIEINRLEGEGDAIYVHAIRRLYTEETDPVLIQAWTELFNRMERSCDAFENVAELIQSVLMKNS